MFGIFFVLSGVIFVASFAALIVDWIAMLVANARAKERKDFEEALTHQGAQLQRMSTLADKRGLNRSQSTTSLASMWSTLSGPFKKSKSQSSLSVERDENQHSTGMLEKETSSLERALASG